MAADCANHPTQAAVTRCASCRRALCADCWARNVDGTPWCEQCIHHLTSKGSSVAVAIVFFVLGVATAFGGAHWEYARAREVHHFVWGSIGIGAAVLAIILGLRDPAKRHAKIEPRPFDAVPSIGPDARPGHPYRAALHRTARMVASPVSGRWTATLLLGCMVIVATGLSGALRLPHWIEAELVLAGWWAIWVVALTTLLYRGWRISDDHVLAAPRLPWNTSKDASTPERSGRRGSMWDGCDPSGCAPDLDGCGEAALVAVVVVGLLVAAWLIVELVAPGLFFLAYLLVRGALARVANDEHDCGAHFGRALGWGLIWATIYALPLAIALLAVQSWYPR